MGGRLIRWFKSAAGKISIILLIASIIMLLMIVWSPYAVFGEETASKIDNGLFGLSTNLLGIIVTVSFVQYFIDKQDEQEEKAAEIATIKRYDRFMTVLIDRYIMFYNSVITPIEKRMNYNPLEVRNEFSFEDMHDMYKQSLYMCEGIYEPSIVLFYNAEEKLRNYMIEMVQKIEFKYNEPLKDIIMGFVEQSIEFDMRGAILGNMHIKSGSKKLSEVAEEYIKDLPCDWVNMKQKGELNGNIMMPYVILYDLLIFEINLIIKYRDYIRDMK